MKFEQVCLEAVGYSLAPQRVSTDAIEQRLQPVYERLRLPAGRLELMTGIQQRCFWPVETWPSDISIESGRRAILNASACWCMARFAAINWNRPRPVKCTGNWGYPLTVWFTTLPMRA